MNDNQTQEIINNKAVIKHGIIDVIEVVLNLIMLCRKVNFIAGAKTKHVKEGTTNKVANKRPHLVCLEYK